MPDQPPFDFSATPGFTWNGVGALRIAALNDIHVAERASGGGRSYFRSLFKLRDAAADLVPFAPHFTAILGDWLDGMGTAPATDYPERVLLTQLGAFPGPRYGVIGNHDCYIPDDRKTEIIATYGLPNSYYTFSTNGIRFIFLDATIGLPARYPAGSDEEQVAQDAEDALRDERNGNPSFPLYGSHVSNGAFGAAQLEWFESWLDYAQGAGEKVVVMSHAPCWPLVGGPVTKNAWDADDAIALLYARPNLVLAWISGHRHEDDYLFDGDANTHFISLPALVDGDSRAHSLISITAPGVIVIQGFGAVSSRTLEPFTSPTP